MRKLAWTMLLALLALRAHGADDPPAKEATARAAVPQAAVHKIDLAEVPHPKPVPQPSRKSIEEAMQRGVQFLLSHQNADGSWGSAHQTKGLDVYAPVPGAHQAFRTATTSLCIKALLETGGHGADVAESLDRSETWLLENLPKLRRATADALYNNWGHAYSIQALKALLDRRPGDQARAEKIRAEMRQQVDMLRRYECVDGGWAYYDFAAHTQQPSGSTISFVTATGLIALYDAKQAGIDVPERLVRRAVDSIHRQRKPDFSYCYGEYLKYQPMHPVNRPAASTGRSQACNLALRLWGDKDVTDDVLTAWLDRLFARNLWLDMGRKRPIPHESWFMVAGYFFYYGHYHAALCIEQLPPSQRAPHQDQLAHILLPLQGKDGSWWDFPLYDYHQAYGTAFALMALSRCVRD